MYFNFLFQGKEEFEKNQRQLMEKGSIKHNKAVLEQQQVYETVVAIVLNIFMIIS